MAVTMPEVRALHGAERGEIPTALMKLYGAICTNPSVRRIGFTSESLATDLWVELADDDEAHEAMIYDALIDYRASREGQPLDLHVVFAGEGDGAFPNDARVVFEQR